MRAEPVAVGPEPEQPSRRYEVLERIAVGGMAEIYLARARGPQGFEKLVVLKRPLPQVADDREFNRMFLDEARLAATLEHPNIAHVYDFGFFDERHFFAMEYVPGADLRTLLNRARNERGRVPLPLTIGIAIGVLSGLHYAHERIGPDGQPLGIVHRDVSPSNVLVSYDGGVKLVDFGIAKARTVPTTSGAGRPKGKLSYMSPEQLRGKPIDRRSDVFSAGILLYEMSTGTRLFRSASDDETMSRVMRADAPPPRLRDPVYPEELERIVLRALALRPEDRYQSAQAFQVELEDWARAERLNTSSVALAQFMAETFGGEIAEWRKVANSGPALAEHLTKTISSRRQIAARLEETETASVPRPAEAPPAPAQARRTGRLWIGLAVLVAMLSALTAAAVLTSRPERPRAGAVPAGRIVAAPPPSTPASGAPTANAPSPALTAVAEPPAAVPPAEPTSRPAVRRPQPTARRGAKAPAAPRRNQADSPLPW